MAPKRKVKNVEEEELSDFIDDEGDEVPKKKKAAAKKAPAKKKAAGTTVMIASDRGDTCCLSTLDRAGWVAIEAGLPNPAAVGWLEQAFGKRCRVLQFGHPCVIGGLAAAPFK